MSITTCNPLAQPRTNPVSSASPVERLAGLAAVPEDEVDVVGRLDGAGQLGLAADHRVHVADRDCKRRN